MLPRQFLSSAGSPEKPRDPARRGAFMRDSRTARLCEGTVIAGKYRLDHLLARGGMGVIWVAQHLQLEELVAIKFMDLTLPDARIRFEREAKSTAQLRSPHVVQILDYGVEAELVYIVMELLVGQDLRVRLKRVRRLPLAYVAMIADQVSKTLQLAHKRGIVHRDLKPANVFLAQIDEDEIVKILDFGIVKAMGGGSGVHQTKSGMLIGSPNYMSPEQARGSPDIDPRTDLWSLGLVLFEALTGKKAFQGDSVFDVIMKICSAPIPVPSALAPDLPKELDAFFARALQRSPDKRFASAREMGAEFVSLVRSLGAHVTPMMSAPANTQIAPDHQEITLGDQSASVEISSQEILVVKDQSPKARRRRRTSHGTLEMSTLGGGPRNLPIPLLDRKAAAPDPSASMARKELPLVSSTTGPSRISQEIPVATDEPRMQSPLGVLMRKRPPQAGPKESPNLEPRPIARSNPDIEPRPIAKPKPDLEARPQETKPKEPTLFARLIEGNAQATPAGAKALHRSRSKAFSTGSQKALAAGAAKAQPRNDRAEVAQLVDQGFSALKSGDRERAMRCWRDALRLDPSNRALELNLRKLEAKTK
jgi:serine/threonine-protein kinase